VNGRPVRFDPQQPRLMIVMRVSSNLSRSSGAIFDVAAVFIRPIAATAGK
jgi:hypothetical protein